MTLEDKTKHFLYSKREWISFPFFCALFRLLFRDWLKNPTDYFFVIPLQKGISFQIIMEILAFLLSRSFSKAKRENDN